MTCALRHYDIVFWKYSKQHISLHLKFHFFFRQKSSAIIKRVFWAHSVREMCWCPGLRELTAFPEPPSCRMCGTVHGREGNWDMRKRGKNVGRRRKRREREKRKRTGIWCISLVGWQPRDRDQLILAFSVKLPFCVFTFILL